MMIDIASDLPYQTIQIAGWHPWRQKYARGYSVMFLPVDIGKNSGHHNQNEHSCQDTNDDNAVFFHNRNKVLNELLVAVRSDKRYGKMFFVFKLIGATDLKV